MRSIVSIRVSSGSRMVSRRWAGSLRYRVRTTIEETVSPCQHRGVDHATPRIARRHAAADQGVLCSLEIRASFGS